MIRRNRGTLPRKKARTEKNSKKRTVKIPDGLQLPSRSPTSRNDKLSKGSSKGRPKDETKDRPTGALPGFESVAVGYSPSSQLSADDKELFQAFQSNLLSLISHELRTPLTGIVGALAMLEEIEGSDKSSGSSNIEWICMARNSANRLQNTLTALLDLAAIESGNFHVRLREVDLSKIVQTRVRQVTEAERTKSFSVHLVESATEVSTPILGDPQKLDRVVDLVFQLIERKMEPHTQIDVKVEKGVIKFGFKLLGGREESWKESWSQAIAGFEGGVVSPSSAFAGTVQSEEAFLTRSEEGLGSELMLTHEIMRLHHGSVQEETQSGNVTLSLRFPRLSSDESLRAVLYSRVYNTSTTLGSLALVMIRVPQNEQLDEFRDQIRKTLFRATDAAYGLSEKNCVAIVMDDCKPDFAEKAVERIQKSLHSDFDFSIVTCPEEGSDPDRLVALARKKLA